MLSAEMGCLSDGSGGNATVGAISLRRNCTEGTGFRRRNATEGVPYSAPGKDGQARWPAGRILTGANADGAAGLLQPGQGSCGYLGGFCVAVSDQGQCGNGGGFGRSHRAGGIADGGLVGKRIESLVEPIHVKCFLGREQTCFRSEFRDQV